MDRRYYNDLKMGLFGDEPLEVWGEEILLNERDRFIEDALKLLREDLEFAYDMAVGEYLAELRMAKTFEEVA